MNIGISQRIIINKRGEKIDSLEQTYIEYFQKFDVNIIPIPNKINNIDKYIESVNIERIILSGGGSLNPNYSRKMKIANYEQADRDISETKLLKIAVKNKIPVLGICRGAQVINAHFDGILIRNIKNKIVKLENHVASIHEVALEKTPFLNNKINCHVNSYHKDGFTHKELADKLRIFAKSGDGIIEGFYHKELPFIGINWHPERKSPDNNLNHEIISNFIKGEWF